MALDGRPGYGTAVESGGTSRPKQQEIERTTLTIKELLEQRVSGAVEVEDIVSHVTIDSGILSSDMLLTIGTGQDFVIAGGRVNSLLNEDRKVLALLRAYSGQRVKAKLIPHETNRTYLLKELSFPLSQSTRRVITFYNT